MKNILKIVCAIIPLSIVSCNKTTSDPPPTISFKTGKPYTSSDATVAANTSAIVGVTAAKSHGDDIIRYISVSCSYNDKPDTQLFFTPLYGIAGDSYQYDYYINSIKHDKEKYTFKAVTQSGASNSVSLTLNFQ